MDISMIVELLSQLRQFRVRDHWTRKPLKAHQTQALRLVRDYTYAYSSFYQQFHKGLYEAPLQDLPVLTKAMLMEHFDDLFCSGQAVHFYLRFFESSA